MPTDAPFAGTNVGRFSLTLHVLTAARGLWKYGIRTLIINEGVEMARRLAWT